MDSSLIIELIAEKLQSLPDFHNLQDFIPEFYHFWHDLGCWLQEELVQSKIEQIEAKYSGAKKKKKKRYYTPLGEMVIERRAYPTSNGMKFKADEELGLRKDKWLPMVLELACALGVSSEFPNAHKLFQKFTNIELTEKTVANQVEKTGNKLQLGSFKKETFIRGKKGRQRKKRQPNHTRCNICRSRWRNDSA